MSISFNKENMSFHIQTKNTSYILKIHKEGYLAHVYYGKKLRNYNIDELMPLTPRCSFSPTPNIDDTSLSLDTLPQEYPSYGTSDFRVPAFNIKLNDGTSISELKYYSHEIKSGKPKLSGLPATYVENDNEAETLVITLIDEVINLKVLLSYTAFKDFDAITRNAKFENIGTESITLTSALSMSIDFDNCNYDFMHLHGSWARERYIERTPLINGNMSIESRRGSSSHNHNPFIALLNKNADEDKGDVYGFNLIYSGNFIAQAEVDQYNTTRVSLGINPFDFSWLLEASETFETPEVVMVYSSNGIGEMSRTYHKLYRKRLCRGNFRDKARPILVNNWEATYFDFNAEKIENLSKCASELGIELLVLDDGWFGKRDDSDSSLGDWFVDKRKLPNGLNDLANKINNLNMQFGLWFEPEMVSPDSELYRSHPDWCLHVKNRRRTQGRNQLVLDFSRDDVCEYIIKCLSQILSSVNISYVKWDMNRSLTEISSELLPSERQKETAHRYVLGLYKVMEKITSDFPNVLFEGCSGGGGRFDGGILYYMPQIWTSDDTDAVERLKIQYGTSMVYPISTMGSHVSAVPNHQVHRNTSLKMRGDVAMSGNFGYELDLTKFTDEEKEIVKDQVLSYKNLRKLIQFGDTYRILSPFEGNETAWMIVSEDKSTAFVCYFRVLGSPNEPISRLKLKGLDETKDYKVSNYNHIYGGDELMYGGLTIPYLEGDFVSQTWILTSN